MVDGLDIRRGHFFNASMVQFCCPCRYFFTIKIQCTMANQERNQQRTHRTTGGDWWQDAGNSQMSNRGDYDPDYGYNRGAESYRNERRRDDTWRRRSWNEMDDDRYGASFGGGSGDFGTGSYGMSDYNRYMGGSGYDPDSEYYRRNYNERPGYYRGNENDYDSYNRNVSHRRSQGGYGFNRPEYGRGYGSYERSRFGDYNDDRYRNEKRDWWDRAGDEVASWFGDDDAERRRTMDKQQDYRGRGPKGYKRSDERIREDISDRLSDDPRVDASDVEVTVNESEVILAGNVPDRYAKRRAEDIADSVSGVRNVENRLRVSYQEADEYNYPTATTTGGATNTNSRAENGKSRYSPTRNG